MFTIVKFFFTVFVLTGALLFGTALVGSSAEATVILPDTLVRDKCPNKPGIQMKYTCHPYQGGWYRG